MNHAGSFGDDLKRCRKARGLSQSELARLSGLRQAFISKLERSSNKPPEIGASALYSLSHALLVSSERWRHYYLRPSRRRGRSRD